MEQAHSFLTQGRHVVEQVALLDDTSLHQNSFGMSNSARKQKGRGFSTSLPDAAPRSLECNSDLHVAGSPAFRNCTLRAKQLELFLRTHVHASVCIEYSARHTASGVNTHCTQHPAVSNTQAPIELCLTPIYFALSLPPPLSVALPPLSPGTPACCSFAHPNSGCPSCLRSCMVLNVDGRKVLRRGSVATA